MASFTIRLKDVLEIADAEGVSRETFIGLDSYPIFDSTAPGFLGPTTYRTALNSKIIDHFYNRQIGMETIQMFKLAVRRRMNEYMPFANQLYKSTLIEIDPLKTIDIRSVVVGETVQENEHEGNNTNDTSSTSGSRAVSSDTPQTMLAGNGDYATSATDANATNAVEGTGSESSTDNLTGTSSNDSTTTGYQGSPAELIMTARAAFMNVDMLPIGQLDDCFMQVWSNGDLHMPPPYYGRFYL